MWLTCLILLTRSTFTTAFVAPAAKPTLAAAAALPALQLSSSAITLDDDAAVPPTAAVIGAGIGGLATAARLAKAGAKVVVLEKNSAPDVGGRVNELILGSQYRFDTGPSLLLLPEVIKETFAELGYDSSQFFEMRRVSPAYKVYFDDASSVVLSDNQQEMKSQLDAIEPGGYDAYVKYLKHAQLSLEVGWPNFIQQKLNFNNMLQFALQSLQNSPFESHHKQLKKRFKTPKMQALLSFQDLYVGLTPYTAPAVFSLLQAIELNEGVYYPMGGFHSIAKALQTICNGYGVQFIYDVPVEEILVEGSVYDYKTEGVRVRRSPGQDLVPADVVVANADLPYVELNLLPEQFSRKGFTDSEYSSSVVAFYWACNKRWSQLEHHTVFLSTDYERSWNRVFQDNELGPGGFNFYCASASRTDSSVCPDGHDAIMVLVPCPVLPVCTDENTTSGSSSSSSSKQNAEAKQLQKQALQKKVDAWVQTARAGVLKQFEQAAGMHGFADSIVHEAVYTPIEWKARYNLETGAVFGLAHGLNQLSVFRPAPEHPTVKGLYFCGASTRPGNGLPLVLTGAQLVADQIISKHPELFAAGNERE